VLLLIFVLLLISWQRYSSKNGLEKKLMLQKPYIDIKQIEQIYIKKGLRTLRPLE